MKEARRKGAREGCALPAGVSFSAGHQAGVDEGGVALDEHADRGGDCCTELQELRVFQPQKAQPLTDE